MDAENNRSLVRRLAIYIACITAFYLLLRTTLNPLVPLLCLLLILSRILLAALVVNAGKKRQATPRGGKPRQPSG